MGVALTTGVPVDPVLVDPVLGDPVLVDPFVPGGFTGTLAKIVRVPSNAYAPLISLFPEHDWLRAFGTRIIAMRPSVNNVAIRVIFTLLIVKVRIGRGVGTETYPVRSPRSLACFQDNSALARESCRCFPPTGKYKPGPLFLLGKAGASAWATLPCVKSTRFAYVLFVARGRRKPCTGIRL